MKQSLKTLMEKASQAYYRGEPFLTNEEYDALFKDEGGVGSGEVGEISHLYPMYSLQKYYPEDGDKPPLPINDSLIKTVKLDGAAVSLRYCDGSLVLALTRGDGTKGREITDKLEYLVSTNFDNLPGHIQITGEVVCSSKMTNARNYASGALNLKSIEEFKQRVVEGQMCFIAYGIEGLDQEFYLEDLLLLESLGFTTVNNVNTSLYPEDGFVFRLNSNKAFKQLGYTNKHPRGAFAEKFRDIPVETTLLDVIWQTGKSGKVTPVAMLKPVLIDDAVVSRATLNNMAYIEALNLEIGCTVKVIRAGKIIPCIVGRT